MAATIICALGILQKETTDFKGLDKENKRELVGAFYLFVLCNHHNSLFYANGIYLENRKSQKVIGSFFLFSDIFIFAILQKTCYNNENLKMKVIEVNV